MTHPLSSRPLGAWLLAATLALAATPGQATLSAAIDQLGFDTALGAAGLTATTYGLPAAYLVGDPDSVTAGPATFTGGNDGYATAGFMADSYGIVGAFYTHQLYGQDQTNGVTITFATPVLGFAFTSNVMNPPLGDAINPKNWPVSGDAVVSFTTNGGQTLNLTSPLFTNFGSAPGVVVPIGFNGVVSDTAFTSVTLRIAQGENFQITRFAVAAVPEPQSFGLLLAGLGVLGLLLYRRPGAPTPT